MAFKRAVKHQAKVRLALAGPSGSGKTYTALTLAFGLVENAKVALIDTERGSASKYANDFPSFDVMELDTFHPDKFIEGIHEAEQEAYDVLIIDSLSHAWNGTGGLLEIVEAIAKRSKSGNTFTAWSEATPIQNRLIDAITRSKLHVICTMRSKQEYVLEKDERTGKNMPRKVGMAPIQRDGLEYEMDCFFEMDHNNTLIVQKSRCSALSGQVIDKPDESVSHILKAWLDGEPMPERKVGTAQLNEIFALGKSAGLYANVQEFGVYAQLALGVDFIPSVKELTEAQAKDVEASIKQRMAQLAAA